MHPQRWPAPMSPAHCCVLLADRADGDQQSRPPRVQAARCSPANTTDTRRRRGTIVVGAARAATTR
jgi:hypothetical protein